MIGKDIQLKQYFPWTGRFFRFLAFGGAKFPKIGNSLPRMPMNCPSKFNVASFILGGEIRNRTNTQKNKQWPIYAHLAYRHVWIKSLKQCTAVIHADHPAELGIKCSSWWWRLRHIAHHGHQRVTEESVKEDEVQWLMWSTGVRKDSECIKDQSTAG